MHNLPGCGLIFCFKMPYSLHWLFSSTFLTQLKPLKPENKQQKKLRALPSSSRQGLRTPDPANPSSEKMTWTSQPTCFCCAYFTIVRHVWVSYISWYVLGSTSLTSLPIFAQQRVKKTQWFTEKCVLLNETTFLPYFMIVWCFFFYQSVCFLTNGVFQFFHQNIMFLCFL